MTGSSSKDVDRLFPGVTILVGGAALTVERAVHETEVMVATTSTNPLRDKLLKPLAELGIRVFSEHVDPGITTLRFCPSRGLWTVRIGRNL